MSTSADFGIARIFAPELFQIPGTFETHPSFRCGNRRTSKYFTIVEDLTNNNLLNSIQARMLMKHWQQG